MIRTGNKNFWIAQTIGWGLMAVSNLLVQALAGYPWKIILYNSISPLVIGFLLTTIYRYLIRKSDWKKWDLRKTILMILGSTLLLTFSLLGILYLIFVFVFKIKGLSPIEFFANAMIFSIIMLCWNLIYFCIHYFNNWSQAEIDKWKLSAEMKDAQLGSLKSQVNPHFVFNTINNIRSLILEDKERAREMLINFSDLFRYAMKNNDQAQVSLEQELSIVEQYLELLSIQYEDRLKYKINVTVDSEKIKFPPMMLQLLVENAVKHGISQFRDGGSIDIDIDLVDGFLNVDVKNTGSLKVSAQLGDKLGVGLKNIRRRLELLYNGKANLQLKELNDQVVASIKIPLL